MRCWQLRISRCQAIQLRPTAILVSFVILLALFLSGCSRDDENELEVQDVDLQKFDFTKNLSTGQASTQVLTTTPWAEIATTTMPTLVEAVIPAVSGSVGFEVGEPDAFLDDAMAKVTIIKGIARAHEVPESYVIATFQKARRLVATSLRRLNGGIHVEYTISVPQAVENLAEELERVVTVASTVTTATIDLVVKETFGEVAAEVPDNTLLQQASSTIKVTQFAQPQTITTTISSTSTSSSTVSAVTAHASSSTITSTTITSASTTTTVGTTTILALTSAIATTTAGATTTSAQKIPIETTRETTTSADMTAEITTSVSAAPSLSATTGDAVTSTADATLASSAMSSTSTTDTISSTSGSPAVSVAANTLLSSSSTSTTAPDPAGSIDTTIAIASASTTDAITSIAVVPQTVQVVATTSSARSTSAITNTLGTTQTVSDAASTLVSSSSTSTSGPDPAVSIDSTTAISIATTIDAVTSTTSMTRTVSSTTSSSSISTSDATTGTSGTIQTASVVATTSEPDSSTTTSGLDPAGSLDTTTASASASTTNAITSISEVTQTVPVVATTSSARSTSTITNTLGTTQTVSDAASTLVSSSSTSTSGPDPAVSIDSTTAISIATTINAVTSTTGMTRTVSSTTSSSSISTSDATTSTSGTIQTASVVATTLEPDSSTTTTDAITGISEVTPTVSSALSTTPIPSSSTTSAITSTFAAAQTVSAATSTLVSSTSTIASESPTTAISSATTKDAIASVNGATQTVSIATTQTITSTSMTKQSGAFTSTAETTTTTTTLSQQMLAQFLIQSTFGPTRASLADITSKPSLQDWISDQFTLPLESHRAYYRAASNPHVEANVRPGNPRDKCKKGSRWHRTAFTKHDIGKRVVISNNEVHIDGSLRTHIDASGNDGNGDFAYWAGSNAFQTTGGFNKSSYSCSADKPNSFGSATCTSKNYNSCNRNEWFTNQNYCEQRCYEKGMGHSPCGPAWQGYSFTGYICKVEETVGGPVTMDSNSNCNNAYTTLDNILIWFASADSNISLIEDISSANHVFDDLQTGAIAWNGVDPQRTYYLLAADTPSCAFKEFIYVNSSLGYLRHDSRLEMTENTLESPGAAVTGALECPTVARTFVNEKSCVKKTTCMPLALKHSVFTLNPTNLAAFYSLDNKYLYEITGLRNEASPCNVVSRWKELSCGQVSCVATSIPSGDLAPLADALALQNGWIRDINVACDANNVPQDAIVEVSGSYFQHIALHEHNVYDFTDWVTLHPGGQSQITMWTSSNHQLQFPSNHPMSRWEAGTTQNHLQYIGLVGESILFSSLPTSLQSSIMSTHFDGSTFNDASYFQSCGSPGEAANDPERGNRFLFWYVYVDSANKHFDGVLDNPYWQDFTNGYTNYQKMAVWTIVSWQAQDQLRQRMGWALSQILVTSAPGYGYSYMMEFWPNYYDIMLRHAFGNYRDLLKEVTYSPVMGDYLTFKGSKSYDYKRFFPDENYAREIMQLFTIGLWELHSNGSLVVDENGQEVPTYDNTQIMSFARIFTGFDEQLPRGNMEAVKGEKNNIDPMRIDPVYRDYYPKVDLYNGFIGDGYPLCSDLAPRAFLEQGRKFIFLGTYFAGENVAVLDSGSALYGVLCGHTSPCDFALTVTLPSSLSCYQDECLMDTVYVVKVGDGYFEYDPPACVNMYFYNGRVARELARYGHTWYGDCRNPDTQVAATSCCGTVDGTYAEKHICGYLHERVRYSVAEANCAAAGAGYGVCNSKTSVATACDLEETVVWKTDTCQVDILIDGLGSVQSQYNTYSKWNTWPVFWESNQWPLFNSSSSIPCPVGCSNITASSSCMCPTTVVTSAVFSSVPTKLDLKAQCFIGAFPPTISCTSSVGGCSGEVKAYAISGNIDATTIFECEGKYYKNLKSMVHVPGGFSFRNPPSFIVARNEIEKSRGVAPFPTVRSAEHEVDALLDQLMFHENTAPFVCYRLIQRFGHSNPSAAFMSAVVEAFKTGAYEGTTYSGLYGDLRATIAAILLHPEARNPTNPTDGSLREPVVKFIHAMRALEYEEGFGRDIYVENMADRIGQEFGETPTVFNFFLPGYQPPTFSGSTVAPEFQLFTPPLAVGWLNGMMSFSQHGMTECDEGFGIASSWFCGTSYSTWYEDRFGMGGQFKLPEGADLDATLDQLDLLLTGGRLTNKHIIKSHVQTFGADLQYEMARKAVLMVPEFHTIGSNVVIGTRPIVATNSMPTVGPYKAVIVLFMHGGADTFNLIIPNEGTLKSEYAAIRGDIKLESYQINPITISSGQAITNWGIHYKLPYFQTLFNAGELAFMTNIGSLVEPITKEQFRYGGADKCVGLFSHQDQQTAAYTLKCQTAGTGPKGNGGRISDVLLGYGMRSESFSIAGTIAWSQGVSTGQQIIDKNDGAVRLQNYQTLNPILQAINDQQYTNVYCNEYAQAIASFVNTSEALGQTLDDATNGITTSFSLSTSLSKQFYQVSRLIYARAARSAERDFFFTSVGGFDAHSNAAEVLETLFTQINDATQELVTELKAQSVFDKVVIVSQSDFGRSLTTNGAGTDHAWAGQHWVIGGAVAGGKMYNDFPNSLAADNDMDAGRGRQIPKYPWESMMVPIANWMGVQPADLSTAFPNINNFDSSLITPECTLFNCPP